MPSALSGRAVIHIALAAVCLTTRPGPLAAAEKKQPNVLIITTDQQRVDAMSAVGNRYVKTPNMDAIAANGVYFTQSYCPYPLCSPSRSALHTSRMPHEIRVDMNSVPIDPAVPLSGQVFRAAGYDTGYSGKWHMPEPYPADGIAGFEVLNKTTRKGKLARDVDEATMNQAIEFLKRKRDKPFLLVASFINPHDICLLAGEKSSLADEVWKLYQPAPGVEPPPLPANHGQPAGLPASMARRPKHEDWDETHWRRYRYAYYRMVEDVDRQIGQILATLRQIGQEEDTLIVFTSDHGEGLGSHSWTGKMMYYEEEAAVPLAMSWKGVTPAGRIDKEHLVSALDVLPTICDYAGVAGPPVMRGQSLRTVIEKPDSPGHEFVTAEMAAGGVARSFMLRTKQYKYMVFPGAERSEMFFNLEQDPGEMKNLAGDPSRAPELERHRKLLAQWNQTTDEEKFPIRPNAKAAKQKVKANAKAKARAARN